MNNLKRPLLLTSALTLSTIGSSLLSLTYLLTAAFYRQTIPYIEDFTNQQTGEKIGPLYALCLGLVALVSVFGVVKMWQSKRIGLYLYAAAQLSLLAIPLLVIGFEAFSSTNTIFTALFLLIYFSFIREFK